MHQQPQYFSSHLLSIYHYIVSRIRRTRTLNVFKNWNILNQCAGCGGYLKFLRLLLTSQKKLFSRYFLLVDSTGERHFGMMQFKRRGHFPFRVVIIRKTVLVDALFHIGWGTRVLKVHVMAKVLYPHCFWNTYHVFFGDVAEVIEWNFTSYFLDSKQIFVLQWNQWQNRIQMTNDWNLDNMRCLMNFRFSQFQSSGWRYNII